MTNLTTSYFNQYMTKIGDRVFYKTDPKRNLSATNNRTPIEDYTQGTIVGFYRVTTTRTRTQSCCMTPGIYQYNSDAIVHWDNGRVTRLSVSDDVYWVDPTTAQRRLTEIHGGDEKDDKRWRDHVDNWQNEILVGELPPSKYNEMDRIEFEWKPTHSNPEPRKSTGEIHCIIDYHNNRSEVLYNVNLTTGGSTYVSESQITELLEEGPLSKELRGETPEFPSIEEHSQYERILGRYKDVRNPSNKLYSWNMDEALQAIQDGLGDAITTGYNLFAPLGCPERLEVVKLNNREVGEAIRAKTLEGFGLNNQE